MKITLVLSAKHREDKLHEALVAGFRKHGEQVEYIAKADWRGPRQSADLTVFVGVKSHTIYQECVAVNQLTLLLDKGYFDRGESYRFALGGFQPFYLDDMHYDAKRLHGLGIRLAKRKTGGKFVIYAGSSQKYCDWHGLGDVNEYAVRACARIGAVLQNKLQIIYRPKPSWWSNETLNKIVPLGTTLSGPRERLHKLLPQCACLVTHGSNSAVEAIAAGVPVVLLSERKVSPVWTLATDRLDAIHHPFWPTDAKREQVLSNLAWLQFRPHEIASGLAWGSIKPWLKV